MNSIQISQKDRLGKNTAIMYIRMAVIMIINLYTLRLVLKALGNIDYGIFDVVAGIVTMLTCLTGVLSSMSQRYFAFALGMQDMALFKKAYSVSIIIYVSISVLILIIGEVLGVVIINNYLNIPPDRIIAANWVFQFSLLSFVISLLQSTYSSAVVSHEDMGIYAIISVIECLLKLGFAILLIYISFDHLVFYSIYLALVSFFVFLMYFVICQKKYQGCSFYFVRDKSIYREMLSFSGWTLFGTFAGISLFQINSIFVNIFFGAAFSASRAIAIQLYNALNSFVNNFLIVVKPPIIKKYANKDYYNLNVLFSFSNKIIYYCLLLICTPFLLEMDTVLFLWLNVTDINAIYYSKIIVVYAVIMSIGNPITFLMQATGKVKYYFLSVEFFTLLCAPTTYVLFRMGCDASFSFWTMLIAALLSHIARVICLKKYYAHFDISNYLKSFILPALLISLIVFTGGWYIHEYIMLSFVRVLVVSMYTLVATFILAYFGGLDKSERGYIKTIATYYFIK